MGKYAEYVARLVDYVGAANEVFYVSKNLKRLYFVRPIHQSKVFTATLDIAKVTANVQNTEYALYVYDLYGAWRDHSYDHATIKKGRIFLKKEGHAHVTDAFTFQKPDYKTIIAFIEHKYGSLTVLKKDGTPSRLMYNVNGILAEKTKYYSYNRKNVEGKWFKDYKKLKK